MSDTARVAVDVGGTFTDVVRLDPASRTLIFDKVPTTPSEPTRGVQDAFTKVDTPPAHVEMFTHGTTLGLNALLTRTGARTAVVATRGFRDVFLLGRTDRRVNFDVAYHKQTPLLERADTFEVRERVLFDGTIHEPFDDDDAYRVAKQIAAKGYESVAVAFLHSYATPDHELRMREVLAEYAPNAAVTLSHELSREYREYERTSTAVLDAYTKPLVGSYLAKLEDELADDGFNGHFLMTRSGGGAMTAGTAREQPVSLTLSGPAGGLIGASAFGTLVGQPNLITLDMGGTSLDASLVIDGEPVLHHGAEFEQLPINTPSLYIHTIGAGGGSIAWLDRAGALQVGPQSAGADPGPASYGRGGTQPTFTDAAVTLGYLGDDIALGGTLTLDGQKARQALTPIADTLDLDVAELARGAVRISTTKIVGAVRAITVELGRDPKDFALLSLGGAGGLVAVEVARELGIPTVVVPPGQGAFCAFGMLMADVQHDLARTAVTPLTELTAETAGKTFEEMQHEACAHLRTEGFPDERQDFTWCLDVRYVGQEHSVTVTYPADATDPVAAVAAKFAEMHQRQYGHVTDDPLEVTTLRLSGVGRVAKPELPRLARRDQAGSQGSDYNIDQVDPDVDHEPDGPTPSGTRLVHLSPDQPLAHYALYRREELLAADVIEGPAVLAERTATTVVHAGDRVHVGQHGELVIEVARDHQSLKESPQ